MPIVTFDPKKDTLLKDAQAGDTLTATVKAAKDGSLELDYDTVQLSKPPVPGKSFFSGKTKQQMMDMPAGDMEKKLREEQARMHS